MENQTLGRIIPTFENLPKMVMSLYNEISELKSLLLKNQVNDKAVIPEQFLNIQEAAKLLGLTKATLYSKVSKNEVPHFKQGNRLHFSTVELTEYLKQGKRNTFAEAEAIATLYLSNNKKGLNYDK